MAEYTLDQDADINEVVSDDENITNIKYNGDHKVITTEVVKPEYTREELEEVRRARVYQIGSELGVDLTWSGEDADSKEEMVDKVIGHISQGEN